MATQALITAASADADFLIDSDGGRVFYLSSEGSIGTVGITPNEAMGNILWST